MSSELAGAATANSIRLPLIIDLDLARRIERAEGMANAACVEARRECVPECGATWIEVAGTLAMFDGPDSPLTQTFGLGISAIPSEEQLGQIEDFFSSRGAPVHHEVCPLIAQDFHQSLSDRGYRPLEWSNVLIRPIEQTTTSNDVGIEPVHVRLIRPEESESWASLSARGWNLEPELSKFVYDFGCILAAREGSLCFIAELNQVPIATASLFVHDRLALLAGAATIPEARRQGAQRALLDARLRFAAEMDCQFSVVVALPGSSSHKNAQKSGFLNAYTRTKWRRKKGTGRD